MHFKQNILSSPIKQSGIPVNIPNVETYTKALHAAWLHRIIGNPLGNWSLLGNTYVQQLRGKHIATYINLTVLTHLPRAIYPARILQRRPIKF